MQYFNTDPATDAKKQPEQTKCSADLKKELVDFCDRTTAHGFAHSVHSKNAFFKVFWVLAIVACHFASYWFIYWSYQKYIQKPIQTKTSVLDEEKMIFPMVTVCNTNMLKKERAEQLNLTVTNETYDPTSVYGLSTENNLKFNRRILQSFIPTYLRLIKISNIALKKEERMFEFGHPFGELIVDCIWNSYYDCKNESLWYKFWHYSYGNCYTFNSDAVMKSQNVTFTASAPGRGHGLVLILNLNHSQSYTGIQKSNVGVVLHIGDQGKIMDLKSEGTILSPGFNHYLGVKKRKRKRTDPFKNNSCIENYNTDMGPLPYGLRYLTKYSKLLCEKKCLAKRALEVCNCTGYMVPTLLPKSKPCTLEQHECFDKIINLADLTECTSKCTQPCEEVSFDTVSSSSKISQSEYDIWKSYLNSTHLAEDAIRASLYLRELETEIVQDEIYYTLGNLLGDIGGLFGLWSGFSILTFVELFELLLNLLTMMCSWLART